MPLTARLEPVPMRKYRVIQWYTGQIALEQVRILARNPHFEIVGAACFTAEKEGRDIGDLAGIGPIGVRATTDVAAVLAIDADVILYNPLVVDVGLIEAMLRSGKNVISIMGPWDWRLNSKHHGIDIAARDSGVSFHGAGNMPGMLNDVLPAMLSGWTTDVSSIFTRERSYHGTYRSAGPLRDILGYGRAPHDHGPDSDSGALMAGMYVTSFDEAHHALADALNILRPESTWETRLTGYEVALAPTDFMIETCGLSVGKGSVAGFRYQIASFINGERWATIEVEHVAMLGLGDSWRQTVDQPEFLIRIQGRPTLEMEFGTVMDPENPNSTMGLVELNAARLVNLIPAVTSAPPGALLFGDLPAVTAIPTDRRNGGFL